VSSAVTCSYAVPECHVFDTALDCATVYLVDVAYLDQLTHCFPMPGSSLALGSDFTKSRTSGSHPIGTLILWGKLQHSAQDDQPERGRPLAGLATYATGPPRLAYVHTSGAVPPEAAALGLMCHGWRRSQVLCLYIPYRFIYSRGFESCRGEFREVQAGSCCLLLFLLV
jgi:hypothetical protein